MNLIEAKKVVKENIGGNFSLEVITHGGDSTTYRIITDKGNLILRTGGKRNNYDVEHRALSILIEKEVCVPNPVVDYVDRENSDLSFSLQEEISGADLFRSNLPFGKWPRIIAALGADLKKVNSLQFPGYGPISPEAYRRDDSLKGVFDSYYEFVRNYFTSRTKGFVDRIEKDKENNFMDSKLTSAQIKKILKIVDRLPEVEERMENVLLNFKPQGKFVHGDLHTQHVMVNKNKYVGMIDFNNTLVAEPLFDLAYWSIMPMGAFVQELAKSAGINIDPKRFNLYRLLISIGKLHTRYIKFNYLNDYPEVIDYALEELNG